MTAKTALTMALVAMLWVAGGAPVRAEPPRGTATGFDAAFDILHGSRFVDLTQTSGPDTPPWRGFPGEIVKTL
jgi:hypothetical protein